MEFYTLGQNHPIGESPAAIPGLVEGLLAYKNPVRLDAIPSFLSFLLFCILALAIGRIIPPVLRFLDRSDNKDIYTLFIKPIQRSISVCTTLLLIYWASQIWLDNYEIFSGFLEGLTSLIFFGTVAWVISRIFRQFVRVYGIRKLRNSGLNVNEILLVFEALGNILVGFIAIVLYAESRDFPWVGIFAGASIGGVALGLAVSKTAEDFLSTLLLYFDNRFLPGDYIRLPSWEGRQEEVFGRVESIGWRSTTIRVAGKNTLYITTNAMLAQQEVENVSRGKRITVLLSFNFPKLLQSREKALINEIVVEGTEKIYGIAPNTTHIKFTQATDSSSTTALINFVILGASEASIRLRKDILESACKEIEAKLTGFGIEFSAQEPNIYIEAPVTL